MKFVFGFLILPFYLLASHKDTFPSPDYLRTTHPNVKKEYPRKFNDVARYLGGRQPEKGCVLADELINNPSWKLYSDTAEVNWKKYYDERIVVLREWAYDEMGEINAKRFKFFYPFSGPDVLHGNMFFRNADTTVMIGLEPVGTVPFLTTMSDDSVARYIRKINGSLHAVLNYSFFRTLSMRTDFKDDQLDGTVPLLMLLLERTRNRVLDVRAAEIDKNGNLVVGKELEDKKKKRIPGVEITYCFEDSTHEAKLYYFAVDISDQGLYYKTPEFRTFMNKMGEVCTMVKSASYLMHRETFSVIRKIILERSRLVLQDDSGIPHYYFVKAGWTYNLYGAYKGVIPLFSSRFQYMLDKSYKTDLHLVKPISFGIGYMYHPGTSNWVLYRKP